MASNWDLIVVIKNIISSGEKPCVQNFDPCFQEGVVFDETFADSMACYWANCDYTVEVSCRTIGIANHSENNIFIISTIADRELPKFREGCPKRKNM
jgi:hypothetical protein